jgi:hypothetical protein
MVQLCLGIMIGILTIFLYYQVRQALEMAIANYRRTRDAVIKTNFVINEIGKLIEIRYAQLQNR